MLGAAINISLGAGAIVRRAGHGRAEHDAQLFNERSGGNHLPAALGSHATCPSRAKSGRQPHSAESRPVLACAGKIVECGQDSAELEPLLAFQTNSRACFGQIGAKLGQLRCKCCRCRSSFARWSPSWGQIRTKSGYIRSIPCQVEPLVVEFAPNAAEIGANSAASESGSLLSDGRIATYVGARLLERLECALRGVKSTTQ